MSLIFNYLQKLVFTKLISSPKASEIKHKKTGNSSFYTLSTVIHSVTLLKLKWLSLRRVLMLFVYFSQVHDPAPKLPAFSAISNELFKFRSKSSHLKVTKHSIHSKITYNITYHRKYLATNYLFEDSKTQQAGWKYLLLSTCDKYLIGISSE